MFTRLQMRRVKAAVFSKTLLYPARSRWGTYRGFCSRRDGDRTL